MRKFSEVDGGNQDGTAKDRVGLTAGTTYLAKYWNDNFFNIFNFVTGQGYTLIDDDLEQITKALIGKYNASYTYNTSAIATQTVNDIVLGSDGLYYECQTDATIGDDPVGSITGNWEIKAFVDRILQVDNITKLSEITKIDGVGVRVKGYSDPGDGAGDLFIYDSTKSAINNSGTIIDGWVKQNTTNMKLIDFGVADNFAVNIPNITSGIVDGDSFLVDGYASINDGGGGLFIYDSTKSAINNGGTIINGFCRQDIENYNNLQFGHNPESNQILDTLKLACWGDSLTQGTGSAGGLPYPEDIAATSSFIEVFNGGVGGESSTLIAARMIADTAKYSYTNSIWSGRNNYSSFATVLSDIASMVDAITHNRFIVLSVLNGAAEGTGTLAHTEITTLNTELSRVYQKNYFDIRAYLISDGLTDAGITPTAQDILDIADDIVPDSLRFDTVHLNAAGYRVVAQKVRSEIYRTFDVTDTYNYMQGAMALLDGSLGNSIGRNDPIPEVDTNILGLTAPSIPIAGGGINFKDESSVDKWVIGLKNFGTGATGNELLFGYDTGAGIKEMLRMSPNHQTYKTAAISSGVPKTNTSGRPIKILAQPSSGGVANSITVTIGAYTFPDFISAAGNAPLMFSLEVPKDSTYTLTFATGFNFFELS